MRQQGRSRTLLEMWVVCAFLCDKITKTLIANFQPRSLYQAKISMSLALKPLSVKDWYHVTCTVSSNLLLEKRLCGGKFAKRVSLLFYYIFYFPMEEPFQPYFYVACLTLLISSMMCQACCSVLVSRSDCKLEGQWFKSQWILTMCWCTYCSIVQTDLVRLLKKKTWLLLSECGPVVIRNCHHSIFSELGQMCPGN